MVSPLWQYVVLACFFTLGFLVNLVSIGLMAVLEKAKPEMLTIEKRELTFSSLTVKTIIAAFAMYLSYCLYMWYSGPLGLSIIVLHWSMVIAGYICSISSAGKVKTYGYGQHFFGLSYSGGMLIALFAYGVKWL